MMTLQTALSSYQLDKAEQRCSKWLLRNVAIRNQLVALYLHLITSNCGTNIPSLWELSCALNGRMLSSVPGLFFKVMAIKKCLQTLPDVSREKKGPQLRITTLKHCFGIGSEVMFGTFRLLQIMLDKPNEQTLESLIVLCAEKLWLYFFCLFSKLGLF